MTGTDDVAGRQDDDTVRTEPDPPTCVYCGGIISEEDVVCPHCGKSLVGG